MVGIYRNIINIVFIILLIYVSHISFKKLESFYIKPMVIFLLSGNTRTSCFSNSDNSSNRILESYNKNIFTKEFKEMYNYKVYISCDDINIEKVRTYFGHNLGNIHIINTDKYLYEPTKKIENINTYLEKYNNKDWSLHDKYENSIHQHYKLLDSYILYENDNIRCDYIVRMRLDTEMNTNIIERLDTIKQDKEVKILMDWDLFAIGTPDLMKVYSTGLYNKYGEYNFNTKVGKELPIMHDYHTIDRKRWTFAPERQLFEMIFDYCNKNNLNINTTIKSVPDTVKIIRDNEGLIDFS